MDRERLPKPVFGAKLQQVGVHLLYAGTVDWNLTSGICQMFNHEKSTERLGMYSFLHLVNGDKSGIHLICLK